ncbi:MAG: ATP-grasp domain-containing protein [Leptospiraceae bacterium]|nr:ATP-grasp domain-containing protein [Leptospiraceae bacterium]
MTSPKIAITGMNAVDSPGPGVPVVRSLHESDLLPELYGLAYDVLEPGNFMDDQIKGSYLVPYPNSGHLALLERIKYIHEKTKINMIFPTLDSELDSYISIQDDLKKMGVYSFLPTRKQLHLRNKTELSESLDEPDILIPKTFVIQDPYSLRQLTEKLKFPIYVKGIYYEAYLARSIEEAIGYFYKISSRWGIPIIVQEAIEGEECNVAAFSIEGKIYGAVIMKKMFLTDKGKAWAGVTIQNPEVLNISSKILKKLEWNSGCELEFIVENKTNKIYLLEINPRFPAWIYLATAAGINLPAMNAKHALGELIGVELDYDIGKVFVRHSWDEIVPMSSLESLSVKGEILY